MVSEDSTSNVMVFVVRVFMKIDLHLGQRYPPVAATTAAYLPRARLAVQDSGGVKWHVW